MMCIFSWPGTSWAVKRILLICFFVDFKLFHFKVFKWFYRKKSGKIKSEYKHEHFHSNVDVDFNFAGPTIFAAVVFGWVLLNAQCSTGDIRTSWYSTVANFSGKLTILCILVMSEKVAIVVKLGRFNLVSIQWIV